VDLNPTLAPNPWSKAMHTSHFTAFHGLLLVSAPTYLIGDEKEVAKIPIQPIENEAVLMIFQHQLIDSSKITNSKVTSSFTRTIRAR
jgi:hypothetical protein